MKESCTLSGNDALHKPIFTSPVVFHFSTILILSVLDSIVAEPHIQIRVAQYGRWINVLVLAHMHFSAVIYLLMMYAA